MKISKKLDEELRGGAASSVADELERIWEAIDHLRAQSGRSPYHEEFPPEEPAA